MNGTRIGDLSPFVVESIACFTISSRRANSAATDALDISPATASTTTRQPRIVKTAVLNTRRGIVWVERPVALESSDASPAIDCGRHVIAASPTYRKITAKNAVRGEMKLVAGAIASRLTNEIIHQNTPRFSPARFSPLSAPRPKYSNVN